MLNLKKSINLTANKLDRKKDDLIDVKDSVKEGIATTAMIVCAPITIAAYGYQMKKGKI